jgi:hypothetical protein
MEGSRTTVVELKGYKCETNGIKLRKKVNLTDNERNSFKIAVVGPCKRQKVNCIGMLENNAVSHYI